LAKVLIKLFVLFHPLVCALDKLYIIAKTPRVPLDKKQFSWAERGAWQVASGTMERLLYKHAFQQIPHRRDNNQSGHTFPFLDKRQLKLMQIGRHVETNDLCVTLRF